MGGGKSRLTKIFSADFHQKNQEMIYPQITADFRKRDKWGSKRIKAIPLKAFEKFKISYFFLPLKICVHLRKSADKILLPLSFLKIFVIGVICG